MIIFCIFLLVSCRSQELSRRLKGDNNKVMEGVDDNRSDDEKDVKEEDTSDSSKITRREIMLLGDSLLTVPEMFFNLTNQLSKKICNGHKNFECIMSSLMKGGMKVEELKVMLPEKLSARIKDKQSLPDAVILHCNSNLITDKTGANPSLARQYQMDLISLLTYIKQHVPYVMIVTPSLYSPLGEIPSNWNATSQSSTIQVIAKEEMVCHRMQITCINMRRIIQDRILLRVKAGEQPKDLTSMVGNKKEWVRQVNAERAEVVTTWDYKGNGGIYTFDGEHLNRRGTKVFVNTIAEQFQKWKGFWDPVPLKTHGNHVIKPPTAAKEDEEGDMNEAKISEEFSKNGKAEEKENRPDEIDDKPKFILKKNRFRAEHEREHKREIFKKVAAEEPNRHFDRTHLLTIKKLMREDLRGGGLLDRSSEAAEEEEVEQKVEHFRSNSNKKKKKWAFGFF